MNLINEFLVKLNFSKEDIKLYKALAKWGPMTLLEASRKSGIERTRLYRLTEELKEKGLIEEIPNYKKRTIKAASLSTMELMVKEQYIKSQSLKSSFPSFINAVESLVPQLSKNNVVYYHGREGIKQMAWHLLKVKGVLRCYSYRFWEELLGRQFSLSLNEEMIKRKTQVRDIYSDEYNQYQKDWIKKYGRRPVGDWQFWDSRYISEKILKVDQNIDIYNDVIAYYHWEGDETFGVEIHNQRVSNFHKQLHDITWKMSKSETNFDWSKHWSSLERSV